MIWGEGSFDDREIDVVAWDVAAAGEDFGACIVKACSLTSCWNDPQLGHFLFCMVEMSSFVRAVWLGASL
jgi:hypothetical protein